MGGASVEVTGDAAAAEALVWGGLRQLELEQNFTGFLNDEVDGDGTLQSMDLAQGGGAVHGSVNVPFDVGTWVVQGGADARHDRSTGTIDAIDPSQQPVASLVDAQTAQSNLGGWAELLAAPADTVQLEGGVRADHFVAGVRDRDLRAASATVALPSGRVVLTPAPALELSASAGRGVQSPESRAVLEDARAPVTLASVYEVGIGVTPFPALTLRGAGFQTRLDDELVFDHTVARYISGGTTQRIGGTGVLEWTPVAAVAVLADLTYADGRFVSTGDPIPFAPRWLGSAGLFLRQLSAGPALLTGGFRAWSMGRRPLPSGFTSRPAVAADLVAKAELGTWTMSVEVDNALGNAWRDGEFVYPSHWDRQGPTQRAARAARHGRGAHRRAGGPRSPLSVEQR